ncbi:MAG: hypothetical protein ACXVCF_19855, partial [Isosphaeraceae bacterium]
TTHIAWIRHQNEARTGHGGFVTIAAVSLLGCARIGLGMSGSGLGPGVILHSALAFWCVACLRITRRNVR